jgi:hypothetical protein
MVGFGDGGCVVTMQNSVVTVLVALVVSIVGTMIAPIVQKRLGGLFWITLRGWRNALEKERNKLAHVPVVDYGADQVLLGLKSLTLFVGLTAFSLMGMILSGILYITELSQRKMSLTCMVIFVLAEFLLIFVFNMIEDSKWRRISPNHRKALENGIASLDTRLQNRSGSH